MRSGKQLVASLDLRDSDPTHFTRQDMEDMLKKYCARRISHAVELWHSEPQTWEISGSIEARIMKFNKDEFPDDFETVHDCLVCPFHDPDNVARFNSNPASYCIIRDYFAEAGSSTLIAVSIITDSGSFIVLSRSANTSAQRQYVSDSMCDMTRDTVGRRAAMTIVRRVMKSSCSSGGGSSSSINVTGECASFSH